MPANVIEGDLFDCPQGDGEYLVHQCNCITRRAAHLAYQVFKKYPHANIYAPRAKTQHTDPPGRLLVVHPVVNLLAQWCPGGPNKTSIDTPEQREKWFLEALGRLSKIPGATTFSFPHRIGCGSAGGNWDTYKQYINDFADNNPHFTVNIYHLPGAP